MKTCSGTKATLWSCLLQLPRRTAARAGAGLRLAAVCHPDGSGGGRSHTKQPDLVTATSGQARGGLCGPGPGHCILPRAQDPLLSLWPPRRQLSLGDGGGGTQRGLEGQVPSRALLAARPRAPRDKPAPRRATHLHSSGNSADWACAVPGAATSSSSCRRSRSRARDGRPAGAGPRWALRLAAAPITPGPGCAAGTGLTVCGCSGPRPGRGRTARAEVELEPERESEGEPEGSAALLGSAAAAPEPRHVTGTRHRPRPAPRSRDSLVQVIQARPDSAQSRVT
jgi:hypothetical protein